MFLIVVARNKCIVQEREIGVYVKDWRSPARIRGSRKRTYEGISKDITYIKDIMRHQRHLERKTLDIRLS